jgi:ATP-dependent Lhr-like helicase
MPGRWVRLRRESSTNAPLNGNLTVDRESIEAVAQRLLTRYGVIFRKLLDRESISIPWRDLLRVLRRWKLAERCAADASSVDSQVNNSRPLKRCNSCDRFAVRRQMVALISVSAADPLNLLGIVTPGGRLSLRLPTASSIVTASLLRSRKQRNWRFLIEMTAAEQWQARNALLRRLVPPKVRAYLNQSGRHGFSATIGLVAHALKHVTPASCA